MGINSKSKELRNCKEFNKFNIFDSCDDLIEQFYKDKLIEKEEKFTMVTERLKQPVILGGIKLIDENDMPIDCKYLNFSKL